MDLAAYEESKVELAGVLRTASALLPNDKAECHRRIRELQSFQFLSPFQYELSINPKTQRDHAEHGGFCSLHTWQYESIASPQEPVPDTRHSSTIWPPRWPRLLLPNSVPRPHVPVLASCLRRPPPALSAVCAPSWKRKQLPPSTTSWQKKWRNNSVPFLPFACLIFACWFEASPTLGRLNSCWNVRPCFCSESQKTCSDTGSSTRRYGVTWRAMRNATQRSKPCSHLSATAASVLPGEWNTFSSQRKARDKSVTSA